jgi:hypothetical protein
MPNRKNEIVQECLRQSESCLYSSTSLYIWLRSVRVWNRVFVIAPILIGGIAGFGVLKSGSPAIAAGLALIAGFFPAIYDALKLSGHADEIAKHAGQFKILQDRFRQAARIGSIGNEGDLEVEYMALMDRMDAVRAISLTPPQKCFQEAQRQIKDGNYEFTVDACG